jgi:hypothetical protein
MALGGRAKLTLEQFIECASKVHNNFYDYSKSVYIKSLVKLTVICPLHGEFDVTPNNHMRGKECLKCSWLTHKLSPEAKAKAALEFIKAVELVHGNAYDYSHVNYENAHVHVAIKCSLHGIFHQSPSNHRSGKGCSKCSHIRTSSKLKSNVVEFLKKARAKHGERYDYSQVFYDFAKTPVTIVCPYHGVFHQTPDSHLRGSGCSGCVSRGFDQTKLSHIYILKSEFPDITKIGVTNNDPSIRCSQINSDANKIDINFDLYWKSGLISGVDCLKVETAMLKWAKTIYKKPTVNFDGCTEAFIDLPAMTAYERIQELLGSLT